ncbi:MAG: ATP-dependent Clp protease ATP-binding subunit [Alistipes sp.]|nr:ATP-dependent Clp protease ATP-binding subunit [Alistipes sp.]
MQVNISKTLEGIIARTAFNTSKEGIRHNLKDFLLLELLREEGAMAYQLLTARLQEWELYQLRLRIEQALQQPASNDQPLDPEHYFRRLGNELCAKYHQAKSISTGHALLDILSDDTTISARVFARYRITAEVVAAAMTEFEGEPAKQPSLDIRLLGITQESRQREPQATLLFDRFGTDLTAEARKGRIDKVIGREQEIERVIQILARRKKNNPMLIGQAGVGKTAIVEGLAHRIVEGHVPCQLLNKRLFALDISALVAGTKFRGEFEERLQQLVETLKRSNDTILFIDEIHTIVGAGATQGSLDTANMLKPLLARGELQTIGATTLDEYREHIERDSALERRFQRVLIEPTSTDETLLILQRIAPHYEQHHRVRYTEEALQACVELTERYLSDRQLPDKAIDLLDEAGAYLHATTSRAPQRLQVLQHALAKAQHERQEALDAARYDHATAARIQMLKLRTDIANDPSSRQSTCDEQLPTVDRAVIERVITTMTGIPIERICGSEQERLRRLEEHLSTRIIGQTEAVERITRSIQRSRVGLKEPHRPIGVFLFVGPTGVGKTLLAKEVSRWLFDERQGLIRLDMSEYSEKHSVARLLGSPPGYVGYGEGGQLTEAVRRHPYAVVLFDEIEKAHPDLFNTLLQLFDEGHLTDGAGRRVDFRNTILIMTSNVGSREVARQGKPLGFSTHTGHTIGEQAAITGYHKALERTFAPEFLNRIDDIILFRPLHMEDLKRIIELEVAALTTRIEALGYSLRITNPAKEQLARLGYTDRYGARTLKRTLADHIEEPLAQLILEGALQRGDTILVEEDSHTHVRLRVAG